MGGGEGGREGRGGHINRIYTTGLVQVSSSGGGTIKDGEVEPAGGTSLRDGDGDGDGEASIGRQQ